MLSVSGRIDPADPVVVQDLNFLIDNHTAAAPENADIRALALSQHIDHVGEKFRMAALVRTDSNPLHVLLNRCINNFCNASVMSQMNHFRAGSLQKPADDIDRGIMAVK